MEGTETLKLNPARQHAGLSLFAVIGSFVLATAQNLFAWVVERNEAARMGAIRRELHGMSDHYLRDIGLTRTDIDAMFR